MHREIEGGPSLFRVSVIALVVFLLGTLAYRAFSQQSSGSSPDQPLKVEIVQPNDALLGVGDVRFGVVIEPGGGAIVANWQNHKAVYIDDQGRTRDLGLRLRHKHTGLSIPPQGMVVFADMQGDYYAVMADGRIEPVPGVR